MKIRLERSKGFNWKKLPGLSYKGYCFKRDNSLFSTEELNTYLSALSGSELAEKIYRLNGCFAIIKETTDGTYAFCDKARSFPLFFNTSEKILSDSIPDNEKLTNDPLLLAEFQLHSGTIGRDTLADKWKQLLPNEYLYISKGGFKLSKLKDTSFTDTYPPSEEIFTQTLKNISTRMVQSLEGRTAVIPLSGGLDSRLIISLLRVKNYENVVCFTYGNEKSTELPIAKKTATALGYKWVFIPYNKNTFDQYFETEAKRYRNYGFNFSSLPQDQDFFALRYLKENKLIPDDAIFIPGFGGNIPPGSFIPDCAERRFFRVSRKSLSRYIFYKHYYNEREKKRYRKSLIRRIYDTIPDIKNRQQFIQAHEQWLTSNRQSKFVVNSVRVYEFFGYEWRMPLWDNDFLTFFKHTAEEYRRGRSFYRSMLSKKLFTLFNIDFPAPDKEDYCRPGLYLRVLVPAPLKNFLKRFRRIKPTATERNSLEELSSRFARKCNESFRKESSVNYYQAKWLIKSHQSNKNQ